MTILWSDVFGLSSNRLSIGGSIPGVSAEILSFKISWQAQYLVRLEGDLIGSAHWKVNAVQESRSHRCTPNVCCYGPRLVLLFELQATRVLL